MNKGRQFYWRDNRYDMHDLVLRMCELAEAQCHKA